MPTKHTKTNWMEHLGFEVQEAGGVPVINEEGDMREADLCHRVLWDEMVSLKAEHDRLSAINAELLEALQAMKHKLRVDDPLDMYDSVCAAIAKAQGEQT